MLKRPMNRSIRVAAFVALFVMLSVSALATRAQSDTPSSVTAAIADLGKRLGKTLTIDSFGDPTSKYTWNYDVFTDTSLECPSSGTTATPSTINGYQVILIYLGKTYDYRSSIADGTLVLCTGTNGTLIGDIQPGVTVTAGASTSSGSTTSVDPNANLGAVGACPANLAAQLSIGGKGQITPGLPNNVRVDGVFGSILIGQIPAGGIFSVLDGPKCDRGFRYWKVSYDNMTGTPLVGWTAEGLNNTYYALPVTQ